MILSAEQWPDDNLLRSEVLGTHASQVKEDNITLTVIDIPEVHCFQEENGDRFFNALSEVKDLDLFSNPVLMAIIDHKWLLIRRYTMIFLFLPFLLYLGVFVFYSNLYCGSQIVLS